MNRATRHTRRISASLLVGLLPVVSAGPAAAAHVTCGDVIVVNTVLDGNLENCDHGLVIGADGIVLNLNGFVVAGTHSYPGILLQGRTHVMVKGPGVIRQFGDGIVIAEGGNNRITGVLLENNLGKGISILNSKNNTIRSNTAYSSFTGIFIAEGASGTRVQDNDIHQNDVGIYVTSSASNAIGENNSHDNGLAGILIVDGDHNKVEENQISGNDQAGIRLFQGAEANVIEKNVIVGNRGVGVMVGGPVGANNGNVIQKNIIANNSKGVVIAADPDPNLATRLRANTFSANPNDQIEDNGTGTVVTGNICSPPDLDPVCD
jgi:parallel beta-helix repeat protein